MKKMTLQDLKDLYLPPSAHEMLNRDGLTNRTRATKAHHRHVHNKTWMPPKAKLSPAEYRRRSKAKRKVKK